MRRFVTIAAALALFVLPATAHAAFPGQNGKIVFTSFNFTMNTVHPDGSGETSTQQMGAHASWSADGEKIAYSSRSSPVGHIKVMNPDGSGATDLNVGGDFPTWSPDGKKIAFSREQCGLGDVCESYLFVMNADGTGATQFPCSICLYYAPSWSPDGSWIAFWGFPEDTNPNNNQFGIWKIRPDGTGLTKIFQGDEAATDPDWSPDGSKLVFAYYPGLATVNVDGTGFKMLDTSGQPYPSSPAWSPDQSKIAFWVDQSSPPGHLEVMNPDGTDQAQLASGAFDGAPSWQPINQHKHHRCPAQSGPLREHRGSDHRSCRARSWKDSDALPG
jgi:Tol biopolymer transport system component